MGGAVSAGKDNDELVDNLVDAKYIKSPLVERVFRAVDRGHYYLPEHRDNAYKDLAWKHGSLHLSAPCIYSEVMESLDLTANLSFLNIGSGTGYLSTMAGLVLGPYGVNHGIELHEEVVEYSRARLEQFKADCEVFDEFEFCEPRFVVGNCLLLSGSQLYDRVYCGAACPQEYENFIKNLLKVGGLLVIPVNDQLLQVRRTGETVWESRTVLPVSFASLVLPPGDGAAELITPPEEQALSLQEVCRITIRRVLRQRIQDKYPTHGIKKRRRPKRRSTLPKPRDRGVTMMMLDHMDSESEEEIIQSFPRHTSDHTEDDDDGTPCDPENGEHEKQHSNSRYSKLNRYRFDSDSDEENDVVHDDEPSIDSFDAYEIAPEPRNDDFRCIPSDNDTCAKSCPSNGTIDCDSETAKPTDVIENESDNDTDNDRNSLAKPVVKVETMAPASSSDDDDFLNTFYADAQSTLTPTAQSAEATSNHSHRRRRRLYSGKSDLYSSSPDNESGLGLNYSEANSSSDISPSTSADASEGISMNTIEEESSQSDSEPSSARIRLSELLRLRFGGTILHPRLLLEDDSGDEKKTEPGPVEDEESAAEVDLLPRNLFLTEMLDRIDQLPLPDQLKAYVAYHREIVPVDNIEDE